MKNKLFRNASQKVLISAVVMAAFGVSIPLQVLRAEVYNVESIQQTGAVRVRWLMLQVIR